MSTSHARGRPRSFDRDAALDTAVRLFWSNGYAGTSVRDLSEALGVGTPSLYTAFGDKQAIFAEAVGVYDRRYGGFIEDALREEPTAARAVARIFSAAPSRYTRTGLPLGCLVNSGDAGCTDPTVRGALQQVRSHKIRLVADKIRDDIADDLLAADTDADGLARMVMAVLSGMTQQARDGATRGELQQVAEIAIRSWPGQPGPSNR